MVTLIAAGIAGSRQAARDWASAGAIVRAVATELKRLYPVLPEGVDVVIDGVPLRVGRADVYVLYTREAVLQAYSDDLDRSLALDPNRRPDRHDTRVFFAEDLRSPGSYHVRSAGPALDPHRPARHFHFDPVSYTHLTLPTILRV